MNFKQVLSHFGLAARGLATATSLLTLVAAPSHAQQMAVTIDNDDIGGACSAPPGPRRAFG